LKNGIIDNNCVEYKNVNGVEFIQFKNILKYKNIVKHGFSTRIGGVSSGECKSLNLGFNRNDTRENVLENFKRVGNALEIELENMVLSNQVHGCRVKIVDNKDRGKGIITKSDIVGYDGFCTNEKEVALVTFYADCVPVFFIDPQKKVTAASHSGWRGTVKRISAVTLELMKREFGCCLKDIEIAVGPSIGKCCFEVGEEVYKEFEREFPWAKEYCEVKSNNKYNISLQDIISRTLIEAGAMPEKICISNICTKCNNETFFSYRGDEGKTGSLAGFIQLI
jgi:YfiH family protein